MERLNSPEEEENLDFRNGIFLRTDHNRNAVSFMAGNNKDTIVPFPSRLSISIRPPCAAMRCLTMDNPSPVPPISLDRVLSTR